MNMELFKQFISMRKSLKESGVYGLNILDDEIHLSKETLVGQKDLQLNDRECDTYPYKVFTIQDGIKLFAISTEEDLMKYFPELIPQMEGLKKNEHQSV